MRHVTTAIEIAGYECIAVAAFLWNPLAGLVVQGLVLIAAAYGIERGRKS